MPSVAVILPTYNERPNIEAILRAVRTHLPEADVVVVDDNSPDGTAELAEKVAQDVGHVTVLNRGGKNGFAAAYRAGIAWALGEGYDIVVQMDADGSHDPAVLPRLVAEVTREHGVDCAIGSRYAPGGSIPQWTWRRRMLSRFGNRYASFMLGLPVRDATSGYRALRATLLQRIDTDDMRTEGYGFQIELAYRAAGLGARFAEVPIAFIDRTKGESKMSSRIIVEALGLVSLWGGRDRLRRLTGRRRTAR
jgi:dolichol-phosphate mannosyltransferase